MLCVSYECERIKLPINIKLFCILLYPQALTHGGNNCSPLSEGPVILEVTDEIIPTNSASLSNVRTFQPNKQVLSSVGASSSTFGEQFTSTNAENCSDSHAAGGYILHDNNPVSVAPSNILLPDAQSNISATGHVLLPELSIDQHQQQDMLVSASQLSQEEAVLDNNGVLSFSNGQTLVTKTSNSGMLTLHDMSSR